MFYSYAMGIDKSILNLQQQGFFIEKDSGNNYMVSFDESFAMVWEGFIAEHLELGYWNEYLADHKVIFLFHLEDGIKRYVVENYANNDVLELCEKLCECKFESIQAMLRGNHFYKDKIV